MGKQVVISAAYSEFLSKVEELYIFYIVVRSHIN
jgi:hypothetical protein